MSSFYEGKLQMMRLPTRFIGAPCESWAAHGGGAYFLLMLTVPPADVPRKRSLSLRNIIETDISYHIIYELS